MEQVEQHIDKASMTGEILRRAGDDLVAAGCFAGPRTLLAWLDQIMPAVLERLSQPMYYELEDIVPQEEQENFLEVVEEMVNDAIHEGLGIQHAPGIWLGRTFGRNLGEYDEAMLKLVK